jgi:hypothetical protein
MKLIKSRIAIALGFAILGTMAMAQKGGGGGGGATTIAPPPTRPVPSGNNPNYNSNYNVPTNSAYYPYGYPLGMDIYAINASSAVAQQQRLKIAEQYRKLNEDMDKLMALTKQLKMGIDSQTESQIPADLVKKASEIEKLAKNMQSQQKN